MNSGPAPEAGTVAAAASEGTASTTPAAGTEGSPEAVPAVGKVPGGREAPAASTPKTQTPRPKPKSTATLITVKNPIQIRERNGRYGVLAGKKAGLTQGVELKVVGSAAGDGRRKVLGLAMVQEVIQGRAVLTLDEAARKAGGDRFVVLPKDGAEEAADAEAEAEAPPAPPEPPPAAPAKPLSVGVRRTGLLGISPLDTSYTVYNAESGALRTCKATLSRRMQYVFPYLKKGQNKVKQGQFKANAEAPIVAEDRMLIECDEGRVEAQIQP